ncbi:MAG: DUF4230 domain-containing protein [Verrucomicrobia bacterium]|nr:DUF4230 domain-containing protein [Verrucomicrobiota bacterium]
MSKTRLAIALLLAAILAGLVVIGAVLLPMLLRAPNGPRLWNTTAVIQQVQTLSQLVTVRMVIEKVVVFEDAKWYGESRVLLVAHGIVKSGVDLAQLKSGDVRIVGDTARVTLPPAVITDAYLDDKNTQVVERTTGVLRQFDKNLEQEARRVAVDDIKRAARIAGIQQEADEKARAQVAALLKQLGFARVDFYDNSGRLIRTEANIVKP